MMRYIDLRFTHLLTATIRSLSHLNHRLSSVLKVGEWGGWGLGVELKAAQTSLYD